MLFIRFVQLHLTPIHLHEIVRTLNIPRKLARRIWSEGGTLGNANLNDNNRLHAKYSR